MSWEDETFDTDGKPYFNVKPLPFCTRKYNKLIDLADKTCMETCSKQSKEQFKVRVQGSHSKRPPPKSLEYGYDIFTTKT